MVECGSRKFYHVPVLFAEVINTEVMLLLVGKMAELLTLILMMSFENIFILVTRFA